MKKKYYFLIAVVILFLLIVIFGCSNKETAAETYSDDAISFDYPLWKYAQSSDKSVFMLKIGEDCVFSAAKYPLPVDLYKQELIKNLQAEFEGDYASYKLNDLNAMTRVLYCDYNTYTISMACPHQPDASFLSSAKCSKRELNTVPKLGLIPIPAYDDSSLIVLAIKESRELGADVLSWYMFWADLEDDWTIADQLMPALVSEGKTAILMNIIYANQLGEFPEEYTHFIDPGFKEDFAEFSIEFIDKYDPDYYLIGGEVDIYLSFHRDEIDDYKDFFVYVRDDIHKKHPDVKVGIVFAYHFSKKADAFDIIEELGAECDIVVYTVHAHEDDFDYSDESRELQYLEGAAELIPDKPYAVIEAGWSSSKMLGSSEEKQAKVVQDYFDFVETSDAEFVIWFGLYEWSDCAETAHTFVLGHPVSDEYFERFEEFMCSLGLKKYDETEKRAYQVWLDEIR